MYLNWVKFDHFRSFREADISLVHPDQDFQTLKIPRPKLPNINIILGNNGRGKSAFLKGIALAALGPAVGDAGIYPYRLVRREIPRGSKKPTKNGAPSKTLSLVFKFKGFRPDPSVDAKGSVVAHFMAHPQDLVPKGIRLDSTIEIESINDLERLKWAGRQEKEAWSPIFSAASDAFFFVGYGATRRVERTGNVDAGGRSASSFVRAQRIRSLFEESYSLIPLNYWLPKMAKTSPTRHAQVIQLINRLMGRGHLQFAAEMEGDEYLFAKRGLKIPFPALSDGYRAYLGWVGDLLYHVCMTCPPGKKLSENRGIVMVDEIDLHLHPKWQLDVLPTIARALPNLQFIVTSHSPLLVGSLEWMNVIVMRGDAREASVPVRIEAAIHGLDADQILLTDLFGLESTRASSKTRQLKDLTLQARGGNLEAAKQLMVEMSRGLEEPK